MLNFITKNFSKPQGVLGRALLSLMNKGRKRAEEWALSKIHIKEDMCVLDLGCGGEGGILNTASKLKGCQIFAVDYCDICGDQLDKIKTDDGKVSVIDASVSNLPFEDEKFDLVTAFETIHFWSDLKENFAEVRRVLKEGGSFCIFIHAGFRSLSCKREKMMQNRHIHLFDEVIDALREAKFSGYERFLSENGKWDLYIATK